MLANFFGKTPKGTVLTGILLIVTITACSSQQSDAPDSEAMEILEQVSDVYSNLEQYHFEANITTDISAGGRSQIIEMPITYAADKPGKLHMDVSGENYSMQMISDGSMTWIYMPNENRYTKKQASQLTTTNKESSPQNRNVEALVQELTGQYVDVTERIKSAELLRTETITVGDNSYDTFVIKADYNPPVDMPDSETEMSPTTFWINQDNYLVVKQQFNVTMQSPRFDSPVTMKQVTQIEGKTINEAPDESFFKFNPPSNAKEVEVLSQNQQSASQGSGMEGQTADNFTLPSLEGNKVELKDFRGKVVLLDFWATWCAPCRRAHPHIQSIHEDYKDDGLVVLGINNESERTAREYMEENDYTFRTLLDLNNEVTGNYQVSAIPSVFIINREGDISTHLLGYQPESKIRNALKEAGI